MQRKRKKDLNDMDDTALNLFQNADVGKTKKRYWQDWVGFDRSACCSLMQQRLYLVPGMQ
jgi:hypothetical protein